MPTGLNRLFGITTQGRMSELRRGALVAASEVSEAHTAAGSFPRTVTILRREQTVAGNAAIGIDGTWVTLTADLTGHVRTAGVWVDEGTGTPTQITDAQRIAMVADIPVLGSGAAGDLLPKDRLQWDDPIRGDTVWEVTEVRVRKADGMAIALCDLAREEYA